jgi:hypothetical protein
MPFNIQSRLVATTIYSQGLFISRYEDPILRVLKTIITVPDTGDI